MVLSPRRVARFWFSAGLAYGGLARAQTPSLPPPPPDDEAPRPPTSEAPAELLAPDSLDVNTEHVELNLAIARLTRGDYASARRALVSALRAHHQSPDGATSLAVLLRLAEVGVGMPMRAIEAPATEANATPPAGAHDPSAAAGALPPPPSDEASMVNEVNEALAILSQRRFVQAAAYLRAAVQFRGEALGGDTVLAVLLRYATFASNRADSAVEPELRESSAPRPPSVEHIDTTESFLVYALGAAYGLNTGIWVDTLATSNPTLGAGIALLGGGAGVGAAYLFSNHGQLRRGRGYAAQTGFYLGGMAGLILGVDGRNSLGTRLRTQGVMNLEFASATGGLALGMLLGNITDARPGSAAFVLTGGLWGGTLGVLLGEGLSASPFTGSRHPVGLYWTLGSLIGAGGAFASAHALNLSPGRTRWIDVGALLGLIVGVFIPIGTNDSASGATKPSGVGGAIGVLAGGVTAYFITGLFRDEPAGGVRRAPVTGMAALTPSFAPLPEGGGMLSLRTVM